MNSLNVFVEQAEDLVKRLATSINENEKSLMDAEQEVLEFINTVGSLMEKMILESVNEPITENRILIDGKEAIYKGKTRLTYKDRFGHSQQINRRWYKVKDIQGYIFPLDHKLALDITKGSSPLLSFLISTYASNESYSSSAKLLSTALGFRVGSTLVQRQSERIGSSLPDNPIEAVPQEKQSQECDLMIVESDGTMSPQIPYVEGVSGRDSLKVPTEYKECNLLSIEKYTDEEKIDCWTGADYGKRTYFEEYFRTTTLKMGLLSAKKIVYIADGAKHNWQMCKTHLPGALEILDFYHAAEHLSEFCDLFKDSKKGESQFGVWRKMILEGEILQVLDEMKQSFFLLDDTDEAQKQINYLNNNKFRMAYDQYKKEGLPIGSGLIEGQCKLVVNKRFKGNGMRWKLKDNRSILKLRLAFLNSTLFDHFTPKPLNIGFWGEKSQIMSGSPHNKSHFFAIARA